LEAPVTSALLPASLRSIGGIHDEGGNGRRVN
jgi:hypothetical protein